MLLVPRQLMRSGMTGDLPYYGGRLSPQQAWAASHPSAGRPTRPPPSPPVAGSPPVRPRHPATTPAEKQDALRALRDAGVLASEEFDDLMTRIDR